MSAPVFLADLGLASYGVGTTYVLDGTEGRHAGVVQRRGPGEQIDVVDGAGTRLVCLVERVEGTNVVLRVEHVRFEAAPDVPVVLVQALAKGDRDELAIEAATEVGVNGIIPWQAERSIVVWRGARSARSQAKWVATVRSAAKQSRRARVPSVADPVDTRGLARRVEQVAAEGGAAFVLHEEATTGLVEALADASAGSPPTQVLIVVGPEGGISDQELTVLHEAGARSTRLGPHVLRTSTAGPVAAAILAERLGHWDTWDATGTLDV